MLPKPQLNPASEVPLYHQLYRHFTELIQSGSLARGDRLPATRELAGLLGLNRTTVSAAYELLESEGLISGQVGRGSFVTGSENAREGGPNWEAILGSSSTQAAPALATSNQNIISFAMSRPSEHLFPIAEFRASCQEVMSAPDINGILQLGSPGGYEPLRQYLLEAARREGVLRSGDDLIITSGCQQALDIVRRVLVRTADKVALEDPVYPGLKNLFLEASADLIGIPVRAGGLDVEYLERVLAKDRPKILVVTSSFQNPTGSTLNLEARESILRQARKAGTVIIENDIYGQLRYQGDALPTIKQLDDTGGTILLRSFSKISFPGLRVGWAVAPRAVIARMLEAKHLCDLHSDQFSQAVLLRFAASGRLEAHRSHVLEAGAEQLKAVLAACADYLPQGTEFTRPEGGMNVWVRLPEPLDASELLARAQREGTEYLPGRYFAVRRPGPGTLRLSFAGLRPEEIREGIMILGQIFSGELDRLRRSWNREPAPAMV